MADDEPGSTGSPPLPRGTYTFNFDEVDENTNPFEPRKRMNNSPERDKNNSSANPFQTKSKVASSPIDIGQENAFQTKSKLGSSPNGSYNEQNPFKTISKLGNSPQKELDSEEDPFKTKSKLGTSPQKLDNEEDPSKTKSKLGTSGQTESVITDNTNQSNTETAEEPHTEINAGDQRLKDRQEVVQTPPLPADDAGDDSQGEKVQDGGADVERVPKSKP